MDLLNDILDTLNLRGALYFRTDFSSPWAISVPAFEQAARFHLVVQGRCYVGVESGDWVTLNPGDLILIPHGSAHVLADQCTRMPAPLETVLQDTGYAGEGVLVVGQGDRNATTQMVCGHLSFRSGASHPLLAGLPKYLLTSASARARQPLLDEMLSLITRRAFSDELGSTAAVVRLSEIVFIEVLRSGLEHSKALTGVVEAMRDRQIGRALRMVHSRPAEDWTVERLAREIGMSRSRFADRFSDLLGMGPMTYLADWRLQKALQLLDGSRTRIQQVATQSGYQSAAAFTRAFAKKFGYPPTEHRKNAA